MFAFEGVFIMRLKLLLALIVGALFLIGCSSQHPNVVEMGKVKYIEVSQVQKSRVNGFLLVKVALSNTSRYNKNINYHFQWLDDQGFPVGNEEVWKSKLIYGGQSTFITSTAPLVTAVDFRIEIQEPK